MVNDLFLRKEVEERQERIEKKEDWKHDGIMKGNEKCCKRKEGT